MKHNVIAAFIDVHSGARISPGGPPFAPHDEGQFERLVAAGCIDRAVAFDVDKPIDEMSRAELELAAVDAFRAKLAEISDEDLRKGLEHERAKSTDDADEEPLNADDDLDDLTIAKLKEVAEADNIDLGESTRKDDIVAAIRAARFERATV